ncbi:hypothetical protein GU920_06795 [Rhodobacter sp. CCP-1]|uniref:Uncharacterized protein n=1 Tax=Paragemmobacter ruber TaxID=1985673 RepID=A0ABW9Y404_9RHOB|nr:hypothetical protein [Rhodobacter ruber]
MTVTADANGNWSHSLPAGTFPPGTYTRTVTATTMDAAENPTTVTRTINIDTEMSVAINPAPFATDNVVNLAEAGGTLTLSGTAAADATRVEVQWNGQPIPATLNGDGTWSIQFPAGAAGSITRDSTITVTAWDAAGNSETATRPIRIDLETAITVEPQPVGADGILSGAERSAGFTLDGTAEPGAAVYLALNGTAHGPITADANGLWSYTFTPAALAGLTDAQGGTLTAYSIDTAGNRSATETRSFTVDTTVGSFTFAAPDLSGTVNDGPRDPSVLNAVERNAGIIAQGTVEPGATVRITVAETGWTTTIPADQTAGGTWRVTLPADALPQGAAASATITATATDALGNTAPPQSQTIAIDTVVADFNASSIRLGTGTDNILNATEHGAGLPVSGQGEAGSTVTVTMNGHTRTALVGDTGQWSLTFTPDQVPTGERSNIPVSVTATDTAGNTSGPFTVTYGVDTVAPGTPTVIETQDVAGAMRGLTTAASDDSYSFHRVDATGPAIALTATETHDPVWNEDLFRFQNGQTVPDGSYLVINTRDAAGNEANTLFIKNTATGVSVDLNRDGLDAFDLTAIDLTRAPDARLSITEDQLRALTGPDQTLVIKGEATDQVTLANVTGVQQNVTVNGAVYDIYTLGSSGAQVLLEDDLTRTVI